MKLWFYKQGHRNPDDTTIVERADSTEALAYAGAVAVARQAIPKIDTLIGSLHPRLDALNEFLDGDSAFQHDDWLSAERSYERAYAMDSTFALAAWWLALARNWRSVPIQIDLRRVYDKYRQNLPQVYQLLLQAELLPVGPARVALFDSAARTYRFDAWAQLLHGNELWGRGALAGISLDSAVRVLRWAQTLTRRQITAYDHLTWLFIRLGEKDSARQTLDTLCTLAADPEKLDVDIPALYRIIYLSRFKPDSLEAASVCPARRGATIDLNATPTPKMISDLGKSVRFGLAFDVPELQLLYGSLLMQTTGVSSANGHEAVALARFALGQGREALRHFDAAAQAFATPEARLEAAEWRALPGVLLGSSVIPPDEVARGTAELERWVGNPAVGARASWDLAWIALARRDPVAAARWGAALERAAAHDSLARPLIRLLQAGWAGANGRYAEALRLSDTLRTSPQEARARFLFVRSALYLARGAWYWRDGAGSADSAERAWMWYDNADRSGWPTGPGQSGDADWALTNYARLLRTRVALRQALTAADTSRACWHLRRVAELWTQADGAPRALLAEARAQSPACGR